MDWSAKFKWSKETVKCKDCVCHLIPSTHSQKLQETWRKSNSYWYECSSHWVMQETIDISKLTLNQKLWDQTSLLGRRINIHRWGLCLLLLWNFFIHTVCLAGLPQMFLFQVHFRWISYIPLHSFQDSCVFVASLLQHRLLLMSRKS